MSSSNPGQKSLDAFLHASRPANSENPSRPSSAAHSLHPATTSRSRPSSPSKRPREENDSDSDSDSDDDDEEEEADKMDFQPTDHVTETQAIGDNNNTPPERPQLSTPQDPTHAALQADMEYYYQRLSESLFNTITHEINRAIINATAPLHRTIGNLTTQLTTINNWVAQIQQQTLRNQPRAQQPDTNTNATPSNPGPAGGKKEKRRKNNNNNGGKTNNTTTDTSGPAAAQNDDATTKATTSNNRG